MRKELRVLYQAFLVVVHLADYLVDFLFALVRQLSEQFKRRYLAHAREILARYLNLHCSNRLLELTKLFDVDVERVVGCSQVLGGDDSVVVMVERFERLQDVLHVIAVEELREDAE